MISAMPHLWVAVAGFLIVGCTGGEPSLDEAPPEWTPGEVRVRMLPDDAFTVRSLDVQKFEEDGSIPERYWGAPLRELKPLRVYMHGWNVAVVTEMGECVERGVYFFHVLSSNLPRDGYGWKFCWNFETRHLEYELTR
jgi:hypothetical protein